MKFLLAALILLGTNIYAQIKLPPPAGGLEVEEITKPVVSVSEDTARTRLTLEIEQLAARYKDQHPEVSKVLYCLAGTLHIECEEVMARTCMLTLKQLLEAAQPKRE